MKYILDKQVVEGAVLVGKFATGFKDGKVLEQTHLWREEAYWPTRYEPPQDTLDGLTVSLVTVWGHNYFHWLTECLTQLLCLDLREVSHIFVPHWYPPFVHESLEHLGLGDKVENWIGLSTRVNLVSIGPQRVNGISYKPGIKKLLERFAVMPTGPKYIYISRHDANERRVLNEQAFLNRHPEFELVVLQGMGLLEQVELFGNAKQIMAPHGAGLANMIWTRRAEVIELFGSYRNTCYQKLARSLGHYYKSIDCRPMGDDMFAEL